MSLDNEQLARSSTNCLENLVISNGNTFSEDVWEKTCQCVKTIFESTVPHELLKWRPADQQVMSLPTPDVTPASSPLKIMSPVVLEDDIVPKYPEVVQTERMLFNSLIIKCVVQLELIQMIDNVVFFPSTSKRENEDTMAELQGLNTPRRTAKRKHDGMIPHLTSNQLFLFCEMLENSYKFAKSFNCNNELRTALWKAGQSKPNLLKQETSSFACLLRILFRMYDDVARKESWEGVEEKVLRICEEALRQFIELQSVGHRDAWTSLLLLMFTRILRLNDERVSSDFYMVK
ncbi:brefeldin A-inhibited guanine nucleotide-exchange protein 1-like [Xenia sp. Carnegie-2017]|uniref:brefeldin A-inhibited guanine nucleotide-exchange protein 1-like n=1 Tax=Xenia sp. Carnegie-2017 TaxID=2897299 RepID=UPI001F033881|nr:brefeldin A-inhibited guanine nucleotide-exchange protein 1-like [Xenia sp. Carnegie-2017]